MKQDKGYFRKVSFAGYLGVLVVLVNTLLCILPEQALASVITTSAFWFSGIGTLLLVNVVGLILSLIAIIGLIIDLMFGQNQEIQKDSSTEEVVNIKQEANQSASTLNNNLIKR